MAFRFSFAMFTHSYPQCETFSHRARPSLFCPRNRRYLLAGEATSSINGRSFIQTAYRASPFGKPMGEPLAVKYSQNKVSVC